MQVPTFEHYMGFDAGRASSKEVLLKSIDDLQNNISKLENNKLTKQKEDLQIRAIDLRKKVEDTYDYGFQHLKDQIDDLKQEVDHLKYRNRVLTEQYKKAADSLAVAQATWAWEAHLARFVIPEARLSLTRKYLQMINHEKAQKSNCWTTIQQKFGKWTERHRDMVKILRKERNGVAHPNIDLVAIENSIPRLEENHQEPMKDMLHILKLTASLMKFGRLAKFYHEDKNSPPLAHTEAEKGALNVIISWDRPFEEIEGDLQKIEHNEAKAYMERYVNERKMVRHCIKIVDFIKQVNGKRLGKLAWEFEKRYLFTAKMLTEEREALNEMKKLLPNPKELDVTALDPTIAILHIPDFLPNKLWEPATNLVVNM